MAGSTGSGVIREESVQVASSRSKVTNLSRHSLKFHNNKEKQSEKRPLFAAFHRPKERKSPIGRTGGAALVEAFFCALYAPQAFSGEQVSGNS
jgi:hypothetical protein